MAKARKISGKGTGLRAALARLWARAFPPPPTAILTMLRRDQYESIQRQIPYLHIVATLNLAIVNLAFWRQGTPPIYWSWTLSLGLFSIFRLVQWRHRARRPANDIDVARFLRGADMATTGSVAFCSLFSCISFYNGWLEFPALIPVSLVFGAFSIAHCLAPLRAASCSALLIGVIPCSATMILFGDFMAQVIGVSAASVAMLKLFFLRDHYAQMLDRLEMHRRVDELARTDPLTGLANRRAFHDAAERALDRAGRGTGTMAIALVDLDGFKPINDNFGHAAGDAVLCAVASRLVAAAGSGATIGRMGGDEFVILIPDVRTAQDLDQRLSHLLANFVQPVEHEGRRIPVGASIGGARFPDDGMNVGALLHHADTRLYAVKTSSRDQARGPANARSA
jgi:diguanylate cyclase (GGDEF)-like protein